MPRPQLATLADHCDFLAEISAGGYRASGRPFYNHLIGTASIVARETADFTLISAALLHSMYDFGQFPGVILPPGLQKKRKAAARRIGAAAEQVVFDYHSADWRRLLDPERDGMISDGDKHLLLLKLADMLEDFIEETGPVGSRKIALWPVHRTADPIGLLTRLADGIGAGWIAETFKSQSTVIADKIVERDRQKTFFIRPRRALLSRLKPVIRQLYRNRG